MGDIARIAGYSIQSDINSINTVSQNVSNINTTGFKRENVLAGSMIGGDYQISEKDLEKITQKKYDLKNGPIKITESNASLAILGTGFFHVKNKIGHDYLTRNGEFSCDEAGYLALKDGSRLEGANGPIRIFDKDFQVTQQGDVIQKNSITDSIPTFSIGNATYKGNGKYDVGDMALQKSANTTIQQFALEASNVNTTDEMLKIIELTKHFNSSGKVLSAYDQMLGNSINTLGSF